MKISLALPGTTLTGVGIYALSGSPWVLLVVVIVALTAVLRFGQLYVRLP